MNMRSQMPRPKSVSDADLLAATARVIGRKGPVDFTIREVADEAGLSAAAILQRHRTKRGLVLALVEQGEGAVAARFAQARQEQASPLAALRQALAREARSLGHPTEAAHHLAFLALELRDPGLREPTARHFATLRRHVQDLLDEARGKGELPRSTDAAALARTVEVTYHGALVVWTVEHKGKAEDAVLQALEGVLPAAPGRKP
jgi:AcrR family transcriptional regulator